MTAHTSTFFHKDEQTTADLLTTHQSNIPPPTSNHSTSQMSASQANVSHTSVNHHQYSTHAHIPPTTNSIPASGPIPSSFHPYHIPQQTGVPLNISGHVQSTPRYLHNRTITATGASTADPHSSSEGSSQWHSGCTSISAHGSSTTPTPWSSPPSLSYWDRAGSTIYSKEIPMRFKALSMVEQLVYITVTIDTAMSLGSRQADSLQIRLTNETNPHFLYYLEVGEEAFSRLKTEQKLVVNFASFPSKFIELLEQCLAGHSQDRNQQRLTAIFTEGSAALSPGRQNSQIQEGENVGRLSLVETNKFKELTHLSLVLNLGGDRTVKEHLAVKLTTLKKVSESLRDFGRAVEKENADLKARLSQRESEIEQLELNHGSGLKTITENHKVAIGQVERTLNAEIERLKYRLESTEGQRNDLEKLHSALKSDKEAIQRQYNAAIESSARSVAEAETLRGRVSTLEAEMQEKVRSQVDLQQKLEQNRLTMETFKNQIDKTEEKFKEAIEKVKGIESHNTELEENLKSCAGEINRGNLIIAKQQTQIRSLKSKLTAKTAEDQTIEKISSELKDAVEAKKKVTLEMETLKIEVDDSKAKLNEAQASNAKHQRVIETLNKQLTENELQRIIERSKTEAVSSVSKFSSTIGDGGPSANVVSSRPASSHWPTVSNHTSRSILEDELFSAGVCDAPAFPRYTVAHQDCDELNPLPVPLRHFKP